MHNFPKNEKQRELWVQFVRRHRTGFNPSSSSALCSMHFEPTDFVRRVDIDLEGTTLDITRQRRLEIGVVPSVDFAGAGFGRAAGSANRSDCDQVPSQVKMV